MPGDLTIEVVSIERHCPVYRVGDRFEVVGGYGGEADLGGLHGVLLDQTRQLEQFLSLKMALRKPPRS